MDIKNKLTTLIISNALPADERLIAELLLARSDVNHLMIPVLLSEIILVPSNGVPDDVCQVISDMTVLTTGIFPISPAGIMSISPMLTAKHMASSVCSLCKKLFGSNSRLKGVLSLHSGIYMNDAPYPGAIIWNLRTCNFITFSIRSFDLVMSAAFMDSFTMAPRLSSIMANVSNIQEELKPSQIIERAWSKVSGTEGPVPEEWNMNLLIGSVLPAAYVRSG